MLRIFKRSHRLAAILIGACLTSHVRDSAALTIQETTVTPNGDTRLSFEGDATQYFILEQSEAVDGPFVAAQVTLGEFRTMRFLIKNLIDLTSRFFPHSTGRSNDTV
jgi:hypothetical protein